MDNQIKNCRGLTDRDIDLMYQIEQGLPIVADVSRADVLLCCLLSDSKALVVSHAVPRSISSLYRQEAVGRIFMADEQPLLFRTLRGGSGGVRRKQILSSGAPAIQDVDPIRNAAGDVIGAMVIESNMIEYERHRRRAASFRRAVDWLQQMARRGEIENVEALSRFNAYDGIYVVDYNRRLVYLSGIAINLFRSIGRIADMRGKPARALEAEDAEIVDQAFDAHCCVEVRQETADGRVWVRKALPLRAPRRVFSPAPLHLPFIELTGKSRKLQKVDAALVLVHNATEAVQKERELNVKSAIIQEVHHRVKNNLQTIAAMLRIQARRSDSDEARQQLTDAVNRIFSMSVIHEFLSQDEHRPINVRKVCQRIAEQVAQVAVGPEQQVRIEVHGPNIHLRAGQATPTALVMNELLLNAVEHGLHGRAQGRIDIVLSDLGDAVQIEVCDDGDGLPDDFDASQSRSLGLQIVHTLVTDDLKGTLHLESIAADHATGTRALVTFPKRSLKVDA